MTNNPLLQRIYRPKGLQKFDYEQRRVLKKLLESATYTAFGNQYHFERILQRSDIIEEFRNSVPLQNYGSMMPWWMRAMNGEKDVVTKGRIEYFALSSGTSEGSSKYVPVSKK